MRMGDYTKRAAIAKKNKSWLSVFTWMRKAQSGIANAFPVKVSNRCHYCLSSIKALPRKCCDGKYISTPKILLHHTRNYGRVLRKGWTKEFLCAMSFSALAPRLSPVLIWTSIRRSPTTYVVGGVCAPLFRDAYALPFVQKEKKHRCERLPASNKTGINSFVFK